MPKHQRFGYPLQQSGRISREIRKILERWIPQNIGNIVLEYVKNKAYPLGFTKQEKLVLGKFEKYSSTTNKRILFFTSINKRMA